MKSDGWQHKQATESLTATALLEQRMLAAEVFTLNGCNQHDLNCMGTAADKCRYK